MFSLSLLPSAFAQNQVQKSAEQVARPTDLVRSPEVHANRTIRFRYRDPVAARAEVVIDVNGAPLPMEKDENGVWSLTTPMPMAPGIYAYHFVVDSNARVDASNPRIAPNLVSPSNVVAVSGEGAQLWEMTNVPHGVVHHHLYKSATVLGLENNQSEYYVYTPPGYEKGKTAYPVLYLLHGWSDDASGWTAVGQANLIFDNLIAQGRIKPMVVVMPLGYGDMAFVHGTDVWDHAATVDHNVSLFEKALLTEVLPQVEAEYHVSKKRTDRAIAGLSMGGLESLTIGLAHSDVFGYVGGFSSAVSSETASSPSLLSFDPKTTDLKLLWIACGVDDHLIDPNRKFIDWLKKKNMEVTQVETPGRHTWTVWRDNLIHFTPLLFQGK